MNIVYSIMKKIDSLLTFLSIILFAGGVLVSLLGVLFRAIPVLSGFTWAEEATRILIISSVFLISSVGLRKGMQLALTIVLEKLPDSLYRLLMVINQILMIIFLSIVGYYGIKLAIISRDQLSPVLQIPMIYPYLVIPVGAFMMAIECAITMVEAIIGTISRVNSGSTISVD